MGIICLTGCMGCGKSSIGRSLAYRLDRPFIDLDDYIQEKEGTDIPSIFRDKGEEHFRKLELDYLQEVLEENEDRSIVLALGGGTVTKPHAAALVRDNTDCWYLRASVSTLVSHVGNGDGRPLLAGQDLTDRISGLLEKRAALYEATAHHIIDTDGMTVKEVSAIIYERTLH